MRREKTALKVAALLGGAVVLAIFFFKHAAEPLLTGLLRCFFGEEFMD